MPNKLRSAGVRMATDYMYDAAMDCLDFGMDPLDVLAAVLDEASRNHGQKNNVRRTREEE